jgi:mono/diheme cytochrome c family protein
MNRRQAASIIVLGTLSYGPLAQATKGDPAAKPAGAAGAVEIWERGSGPTTGGRTARGRSQRIDLDRLPLVDVRRVDVQYGGGPRAFRGIPLQAAIDRFAPDAGLDLAILHFRNGMAVPVPFRDAAVMKRLDPFIARGMETNPAGPIRVDFFPDIPKEAAAKGAATDVRPITFSGNKLVVADRWHPAVRPSALAVFSPWAHVDTLASIELVTATPYYGQFDPGIDTAARWGFELYRETCQFCHGARKVGATFGWDFVEPLPLYGWRNEVRNLYYHVAYKPIDAPERGLMMPAMKFMTEHDAEMLQHWLRAVATKPMPPYAPTRAKKALP